MLILTKSLRDRALSSTPVLPSQRPLQFECGDTALLPMPSPLICLHRGVHGALDSYEGFLFTLSGVSHAKLCEKK